MENEEVKTKKIEFQKIKMELQKEINLRLKNEGFDPNDYSLLDGFLTNHFNLNYQNFDSEKINSNNKKLTIENKHKK